MLVIKGKSSHDPPLCNNEEVEASYDVQHKILSPTVLSSGS